MVQVMIGLRNAGLLQTPLTRRPAVVAAGHDLVDLVGGVLAELGGVEAALTVPGQALDVAVAHAGDPRTGDGVAGGDAPVGVHAGGSSRRASSRSGRSRWCRRRRWPGRACRRGRRRCGRRRGWWRAGCPTAGRSGSAARSAEAGQAVVGGGGEVDVDPLVLGVRRETAAAEGQAALCPRRTAAADGRAPAHRGLTPGPDLAHAPAGVALGDPGHSCSGKGRRTPGLYTPSPVVTDTWARSEVMAPIPAARPG